eukprot:Opistho-2@47094
MAALVSVPPAVVTDTTRLFNAFRERGKGYAVFCDAWRALNFSMIHYAGRDEQERTEALEEFVAHGAAQLSASHSMERRVFAIYFVYALYTSQPLRQVTVGITAASENVHYASYCMVSLMQIHVPLCVCACIDCSFVPPLVGVHFGAVL